MSQEFDYREVATNAKNAEQKLAGANKDTITNILDEINSDLRGRGSDYQQAFLSNLNDRMNVDGVLPGVLMNYTQADYDFLAQGHNRINNRDLNRDAVQLHNENRPTEEMLVRDMQSNLRDIQKSKHEHKFLFFGTKHGADERQFEHFKGKADDKAASEQMLTQFGVDEGFARLAGGKPFISKADLTHALNETQLSNRFSYDEQQSMHYMLDNFKKMSVNIDPVDTGMRGITEASMDKFAARRGATYEGIDVRQQTNAYWDSLTAQPPVADAQPPAQDAKAAPQQNSDATATPVQAADKAALCADVSDKNEQQRSLEMQIRQDSVAVVQPGDTLSQIAESKLIAEGSEDLSPIRVKAEVHRLQILNGIQNPNFIVPGQQIYLYSESEIQRKIAAASKVSD